MIRLPVSIGEAMDKLTILDIKLQKIETPEKRAHCQAEYDALLPDLKPYVEAHSFYYARLRDINLQIWEMQDEIRVRPNPQKCVEILDKNDMRFRIKDTINTAVSSYYREQKGYSTRRALVLSHLGLGDHIGLIGAVRYIALQHDQTVVVCMQHNAANVASFFADLPSVVLWVVDRPYSHLPTETRAGDILPHPPVDFTTVYRAGYYAHPRHSMDDLPRGFYLDMGLHPDVRHTYFHVPTTPDAQRLYDLVRDIPYRFVQQSSSSHTTSLVTWDTSRVLTIDPNTNLYPPDHDWHSIAQECVNRPMLSYTLLLQHAEEVHTVDSAFYCLACYLPLEATVKQCYARETGAFISTYTFT
jgi:hypothetical protein